MPMNPVQLELNFNGVSNEAMEMIYMQKQVNELHMSVNKIRRKLFAENGELKKSLAEIQLENLHLKEQVRELMTDYLQNKSQCVRLAV
jgi:hypothetical protein